MVKPIITSIILVLFVITYLSWLSRFSSIHLQVSTLDLTLPFPLLVEKLERKPLPVAEAVLPTYTLESLTKQKADLVAQRRQERINKVESYFRLYGSSLVGYGHIFVDQSEQCGGDYRVLVGIAGSESGLGRINVLKYNPFGYLDGVQYSSQEEALTILSCRISQQHIAPCGQDLYCLGRRYAGPSDDLDHFVSKVAFFFDQVD
jgi:hypothetical protein